MIKIPIEVELVSTRSPRRRRSQNSQHCQGVSGGIGRNRFD